MKLRNGYTFFESKDCFLLKLLSRWWWIKLDFEDKGNMFFFQALKQSTKLAPSSSPIDSSQHSTLGFLNPSSSIHVSTPQKKIKWLNKLGQYFY
jgi:hypothetical protein